MAWLSYHEILLILVCFLLFNFLGTINRLPLNWPLLGMLPSLLVNFHRIHDWCTDCIARAGGTILFKGPYFANMDMLVTTDPANLRYIWSTNLPNYPKGPKFKKIYDILGDGIFTSDGEQWRYQRKLAHIHIRHQRFSQFLIKSTQEKVEKSLMSFLEHVSKQGLVIDLQDLFQRYTFDTTCILVTSYDPKCLSIELPDVAFSKALDNVKKTLMIRHVVPDSFWKWQRWQGIGHERKMSKDYATIDYILAKYISKKREELGRGIKSKEENEGADLLTSYLTEDGIGSMFDDQFLRDTLLTFMVAGRDTTSSGLTWFFWLVFTHPNVEAKIREELETIVPDKEAKKWKLFGAKEVRKLVYFHSALCESLRLYPPIPFLNLNPLQPDILPSGHHVNPRMRMIFSSYAMGRMKSIWGEDCLEFKPERWISKEGSIKHEPQYKFVSFGAGPRACLGKEIAFTQMGVAAASMIYNYNIEVVEGHQVDPTPSIVLYVKHGLMVKITDRGCSS